MRLIYTPEMKALREEISPYLDANKPGWTFKPGTPEEIISKGKEFRKQFKRLKEQYYELMF